MVASLFPSAAVACDYFSAKVSGDISLTYNTKGMPRYSYNAPHYEADTFRLNYYGGGKDGMIGLINLTIEWPEASDPLASLAGTPRWDLLIHWGMGKSPPPLGSDIAVKGDGKEIARLAKQTFPRISGYDSGGDKYFFQGPAPDFRRYRSVAVEVVPPDGRVAARAVFAMPNWSRFPLQLEKTRRKLVRVARGDTFDAPECHNWPIAN